MTSSAPVVPASEKTATKLTHCPLCDIKFGYVFSRKTQCGSCNNHFCSGCASARVNKDRYCKNCYRVHVENTLNEAMNGEDGDLDETKLSALDDGDADTNMYEQSQSSSPRTSDGDSTSQKQVTPQQEKFLRDQAKLAPLIAEFRARLQPLLTPTLLSSSSLARESSNDRTLIRFLTARKFNVEKALSMWQSVVQWRMENQVDQILIQPFPLGIQARRVLNNQYDHKFDKDGHPVYIEILETLDIPALMEKFTMDEMLRYIVHSTEFRRKYLMSMGSIQQGKLVDQVMTILDMKNLGRKQMKKVAFDFVRKLTNQSQANYPENLSKMFFVNCPKIFSLVWKVISPWFDERTRSKIVISSGPATDQLLQIVDAQCLPQALGGTCACVSTDKTTTNVNAGTRHTCMHASWGSHHYEALCELGWNEFVKKYPFYAELEELNQSFATPDRYTQLLQAKHKEYETLLKANIVPTSLSGEIASN